MPFSVVQCCVLIEHPSSHWHVERAVIFVPTTHSHLYIDFNFFFHEFNPAKVHKPELRLAAWLNRALLQVMSPNWLVTVNILVFTPVPFQRRTSGASTYHIADDIATIPAKSEIYGAQTV